MTGHGNTSAPKGGLVSAPLGSFTPEVLVSNSGDDDNSALNNTRVVQIADGGVYFASEKGDAGVHRVTGTLPSSPASARLVAPIGSDGKGPVVSTTAPSPVLPCAVGTSSRRPACPSRWTYLGFRAPLVPPKNGGKALVVPVTNIDKVVKGSHATFGTPITMDLGGLSVRDMRKNADNQYLIIAGTWSAEDNSEPYALYRWVRRFSTATAPRPRTRRTPSGRSPASRCSTSTADSDAVPFGH